MKTPLAWRLEPDPVNPRVRCFALTGLLDYAADDPMGYATKPSKWVTLRALRVLRRAGMTAGEEVGWKLASAPN